MTTTTEPTKAPRVISAEIMVPLERFRGTFEYGHTSEDAFSVLESILDLTGLHFAILWDFNDCWGQGGNSELVMLADKGRIRTAPSAWIEFLYHPGNQVTAEQLSVATPGNCILRWQRARSGDAHNLFWKLYAGEAPN